MQDVSIAGKEDLRQERTNYSHHMNVNDIYEDSQQKPLGVYGAYKDNSDHTGFYAQPDREMFNAPTQDDQVSRNPTAP